MEVATTNNHSQSHHHHPHHHHHLQTAPSSGSGVGIVSGIGGSRSPFQREVREWQRIDPNTGALFSGRLEADRWINGPLNSYGKKSSSSISSQSSNNSNLTTAAAQASNTHTHRSAGKISLHAIVGPESSSSLSSSSSPAAWAKQADLYGQPPSRVGGAGTGVAGGADADVAATPPTHRRDLESFRHYNDDGNSNNDDEELRLTARHQRRQQVSQSVYAPPLPSLGSSMLQRSRSISTDDLSNDWEREDKSEQPTGEWRRVSKLRRSFQSQEHYKSPAVAARPRPLDLPGNSVSVARLRAELENGRRLNTAMRNNHVDLAALDTILNSPTAKPTVAKRNTFLTAESLQEIRGKLKKLSDESLYKEDFLAYHQKKKEPSVEKLAAPQLPAPSAFRPVHNTHSLESRQRQKDTSSSEWHLRRKSYGFEKMSPPEDKSIFRVDASTDSGLGRSGEQLGNWSPTERSGATMPQQPHNGGGTIIHFGRAVKPVQISPSPTEGELSKRHSIAVEETWRDLRKTSQVHVNGGTVTRSSTTTSSSFNNHLQRGSAQKRVEFCKTEVHFAAESGRVNIVETDGKPPPTQNFRRRRRTASGPLQSLVKSASTVSGTNDSVTQFGDDSQRRKTIATSTVAYRATLMDPPEVVSQQVATQSAIGSSSTVSSTSSSAASTLSSSQVTVTTEPRYSLMESTSRNSYTSTSGVDTTDNETDELSNIRGILKNKPVKPKPYHLGENIESADVLWSVPAMKTDRESPSARDSGTTSVSPITTKSVAERIRIVEQRQHQPQPSPSGNGYSTKINVSLGASEDWPDAGTHLHQQRHRHRRPSAQELLLEDLRQHQRILDEGLKSTSLIMRTMRSASEFDEAMRRLSIASIESALVQPTIVVPTPMLRSHSYQEEGYIPSRRPSTISTTSITSSDLFGSALYDSLPRTPLAPPRLKLLGNTQIPVSQQLIQLRRLYDAADQDQDQEDSADEEVKRYFRDNNSDSGGGTQGSSSPEQQRPAEVFQGSEYSSSWSRMKAKRTIWKIETQDQILQRADLPKSNVMNIALHAPRVEKPKATPPTLRIGQLVPVAKPRTLFIQPQIHDQAPADAAEDSSSETLKIIKEARGARKLREHELSYFGVQQQQASQTKLSTGSTNPRRTLPSRSRSIHSEEASSNGTTKTTTKWQLLNDRPDLLRHSSPQHNDIKTTHDYDEDENENEEHCYENIANELTTTFRVKSPSPSPDRSRSRSPGSYERKRDLQRDAQILSEMTRNADQTLKALSDEAAIKDQRRRSCSLQRRSSKPLETIDEKVKVYPASQSLGVARGTFASEARRNSRQSTPSPTRARSSSQSSIECCPRDRSRSSSRESMTQGGGSSDDQMATKHRAERLRLRTPKREKSRHETQESELRIKPRTRSSAHAAGSSSLESKRSSHHGRNSNREVEKSSETKTSSGSRLVRSSRVAEENRSRQSGLRERDRERSRGSEKHREELSRSRGHSSRSRHSEHTTSGTRESSRPSKTRSSRSSHDSATPHKKSTTTTTSTTSAKKSSKTTAHHTATTTSASAPPTSHNELTHGKSTLNGHHQNQLSGGSGKHHGSGHGHREQPHHVHSLTTTTIAASRHQRDRHGKDRK
ncbi:serine-rich adhesin for platelets isoform X7 [Drosophila bipectinata]|uniref:serine-rich adhesin for platelets isoform X7 n=1 Tax=Drosophila bipectinata TaxID=42026 RepID=UPI001C8ACF38|nr:serine-rich adhesin for platelets isoform X6 [Drosophila bipectinata]